MDVPMQNLPRGRRATIVPGKTYEYLASGRPVLAAVPEGDARDLVSETAAAWACVPDDVGAIAAILEAELRRKREHGRRPDVRRPELDRFERRRLGRELAELVDRVAPAAPRRARPELRLVG